MTWKNAFDVGPCEVTVYNHSGFGFTLFSGVLAKGETSANFGNEAADTFYNVSVGVGGSVSLNWLFGNIADKASVGFELSVSLQSAIDAAVPLRISGITIVGAGTGVYAFFGSQAQVPLAGDAAAWLPDPATGDTVPNDFATSGINAGDGG